MTFAALRSVPKSEWVGILSSVSSFLLPSHAEKKMEMSEVQREVLRELASRFGDSAGEIPVNSLPAAQGVLLKELSSALIRSKPNVVRARVAQKGLLPSHQYQIRFTKKFLQVAQPLGISQSLATIAIERADSVEHLHPAKFGMINVSEHTLFLKTHPEFDNCSVLILAIRNETKFEVEGGWLIFHDLVGAGRSDSPLICLQQLAERYGMPFYAGDFFGKFLIHGKVEITPGQRFDIIKFQSLHTGFADYRFSHALVGLTLHVALAFVLNVDEYVADLLAKGVKVRMPEFASANNPFLRPLPHSF